MKKAKARRLTSVRLSPKLWPTSELMAPMTLVIREMTKKVNITSATMPRLRREAVAGEGMTGPDGCSFIFGSCLSSVSYFFCSFSRWSSRMSTVWEKSPRSHLAK